MFTTEQRAFLEDRAMFETCEHLTPIGEDCLECEPLLDPEGGAR